MRILAFIISGIGIVVVWPVAAVMTGFAHDQEQVPAALGLARNAMIVTLFAVPLIWVAGSVAALIIHFGMKVPSRPAVGDTDADLVREAMVRKARRARKHQLLNRCAAAPFVAAGLHVATWGLVVVAGR